MYTTLITTWQHYTLQSLFFFGSIAVILGSSWTIGKVLKKSRGKHNNGTTAATYGAAYDADVRESQEERY